MIFEYPSRLNAKPRGTRMLREFLHYAETKHIAAVQLNGADFDRFIVYRISPAVVVYGDKRLLSSPESNALSPVADVPPPTGKNAPAQHMRRYSFRGKSSHSALITSYLYRVGQDQCVCEIPARARSDPRGRHQFHRMLILGFRHPVISLFYAVGLFLITTISATPRNLT
jgi:hypothetical protein